VAFILSFLFGYYDKHNISEILELWGSFYLPFMYSLISCLGVLMLLLFTPVGFAHLFTAMGQLMVKPGFLRDLAEEYQAALMREDALARQLSRPKTPHVQPIQNTPNMHAVYQRIRQEYTTVKKTRLKLEEHRRAGVFQRTLAYPLALVVLLALTGTAIIIVVLNTLQLLIGIKALPLTSAPAILGEAQQGKRTIILVMIGPLGAAVEVVLILYLIAASILGCYSLPGLAWIRPKRQNTPMVHIIANCVVVLVLSSALPLLSRTLGITNFDLLGDYGRIGWLGNFWVVFGYNVLFATASAACLVKKFTATLRHEIYIRFKITALALMKRENFKLSAHLLDGGYINTSSIKEE